MYISHEIGRLGERACVEYLEQENNKIVTKNYRTRLGEIDIITRDLKSNELVFIEVKTRTNSEFGDPIDSIDKKKILNIYKSAQLYILKNKLENENIRLDIMEVFMYNMKVYRINHIKNIYWD